VKLELFCFSHDINAYQKAVKVFAEETATINIQRDPFHGE
jgi:hypothetical protein